MPDNESGGILDLILTQAARQVADELGAELAGPAPEEECTRRAAAAPTARHRPGRLRAFRWAACLVAVMFMGSAGVAVSVKAVRGSVINFMFDPDAPETQFIYLENLYGVGGYTGELVTLSYIPDHFTCTKDRADSGAGYEFISFDTSAYSGDDCLWFNFTLDSETQQFYLDTEGGTVEEAEVNGHEAEYIKNPDYSILLWYIDGNPCIVAGNITKIDMFKIAENVKPI